MTGGTDGIGKEIARGLAFAGHNVSIVGRDSKKGLQAEHELRQYTRNPRVHFVQADLSLISETRRLTGEISRNWPALHYMVHSAGIVRGHRILTAEGFESNFAINFLSRFALTSSLLPLLRRAGEPGKAARIVIIGGAARTGRIFDDPNLTQSFSTLRAIRQFCHANDVFTVELARRLGFHGTLTVTSIKMGVVKTNIRREFPIWMKWLLPLGLDPLIGQTPQQAAAPAVRLLLGPEFEGMTGMLFLKIRKFKKINASARALDPAEGTRLWELANRLTMGVRAAGFFPRTSSGIYSS